MQEVWRIELFGGLRLVSQNQTVSRFRTRHDALLLAYLALNLDSVHPREHLVSLLYPDDYEADNSGRFKNAMWALRRQLEPPGIPKRGVLLVDRYSVGLNPPSISTDVDLFKKLIAAATKAGQQQQSIKHLENAVRLYQGELLPGFYEEWILAERDLLTDLYTDTLKKLCNSLRDMGEFRSAASYARKLIKIEPTCEEAHQHLMHAHVKNANPAAALRQYKKLETLLAEELNVRPSEDTRRLAAEARHYSTHSSQPPAVLSAQEKGDTQSDNALKRLGTGRILPLTITRFFGREQEIEQAKELLLNKGSRLLTLIGLGGCGKTRLSIELAKQLEGSFEHIVFLPMANLSEPKQIPEACLSVLGISRNSNYEALEQLCDVFAHRSGNTLLIADNAEHLLGETQKQTVDIFREILERASDLSLLVTSRNRLGVTGEQELHIQPLPTFHIQPGKREHSSTQSGNKQLLENMICYPSIQMFLDRAQLHTPYFQATHRNATDIVAICEKLEGIPLAIELAAAWTQTLTPSQLLEQLEKRFQLLISRSKDTDPRHQTLHTAIDYSFQQLSPELQEAFLALSVFNGGWSLEAATQIINHPNFLSHLTELRERSMIFTEERRGLSKETFVSRFDMLETLREFCLKQMEPKQRHALSKRHAEIFATLAEDMEKLITGSDQVLAVNTLSAEHSNLRSALEWCVASAKDKSLPEESRLDALELGLRLAVALMQYWDVKSLYHEGIAFLESLLSLCDDRVTKRLECLHAYALMSLGNLKSNLFLFDEARKRFEEAIESAKRLNDDKLLGVSLRRLGTVGLHQEQYDESEAVLTEAIEILKRLGDGSNVARALNTLGALAIVSERHDQAAIKLLLEESVEQAEQAGDLRSQAVSLLNLATLADEYKEVLQCYAYAQRALPILRTLDDRLGTANALLHYSYYHINQGDTHLALKYLLERLDLFRQMGHRIFVDSTLLAVADILLTSERYQPAALVLGHLIMSRDGLIQTEDTIKEIYSLESALSERVERSYSTKTLQFVRTQSKYVGDFIRGLRDRNDSAIETAFHTDQQMSYTDLRDYIEREMEATK